ncbi:IQ and ubiquitin-like domain-containing protein [Daktulosphaira vitifoliae]|uniref:IQ and ubiquitin-like domain-containing protein n=1 Tax=Daktulosphaira vitifoliae TaxID=58002 RepID=UPI0021A9B880|nr:IQ and ubiquitin-like domain-containing protein [Daktulosphaira vitifoliae]
MLNYYNYLINFIIKEENDYQNQLIINEQSHLLNLKYPTKVKDFEALYSAINDSSIKNKTNLKCKLPVFAKAEGKRFLDKELECLKEITKHRNRLNAISKERKILKLLDQITKPVTITPKSNGYVISIDNPIKCQGKQLNKYYIALKSNHQSKNDRIKLLLELIEILKKYKEPGITSPLINLLNKELDMLDLLQLKKCELQNLRKLIEVTFRSILLKPEINPAITLQKKIPKHFNCFNCRNLKQLEKFTINLNLKSFTMCKDCNHLKRIAIDRISLLPYDIMLKDLKMNEAKLCTKSSIVFLLSTEDVYYLATVIWKGKSAISESNNLLNLRLTRWCSNHDWSPSNTILLTIREAYDHLKINDLKKIYTSSFIEKVNINHITAKKYFKNLKLKSIKLDQNIFKKVKTP